MEIFIVLGLCFVLYEALDLFQGCYHQYYHRNTTHLPSLASLEDGSSDDVEDSDTKHLLAPSCEASGECGGDWEKSGKFTKVSDRYTVEDECEKTSGNKFKVFLRLMVKV
uniref:Secreted protein n=1 Tax=Lutzomyia longipalpis TaxID=7200 RepID=A0A1B0CEW1_LUTLO